MPLRRTTAGSPKKPVLYCCRKAGSADFSGKYALGSILPGEMELGEQFGVSRTAVREAVETFTAKRHVVLPRPPVRHAVMPPANWNFLDQELLSRWMTEDNFNQVVDHFLLMQAVLSRRPACLPPRSGQQNKSPAQHPMEEMVFLKKHFNHECWVEVDIFA